MGTYGQLRAAGVSTRTAADLTGVPRSSATRPATAPVVSVPRPAPANALSAAERAQLLGVLDGEDFVDASPAQVHAVLLDQGKYLASVSTMYRVLRANAQVKDRRRQAAHPARAVPELVADGPGQVCSWDITKLKGPTKGVYYDAYVMIDIYSRYIVAAQTHAREDGVIAAQMMARSFGEHGIPLVVHADRGAAMTSKSVADLLEDLGVTRSHGRPKVSNDNPYSEAWFKTLKYAPVFPERFASLAHARAFINDFVAWYNHGHRHSGIGMHTPAQVHHGRAEQVRERRSAAMAAARAAHPERFAAGSTLLPAVLQIPTHAWINKPDEPAQPAVA